jgi:hypothetical protein
LIIKNSFAALLGVTPLLQFAPLTYGSGVAGAPTQVTAVCACTADTANEAAAAAAVKTARRDASLRLIIECLSTKSKPSLDGVTPATGAC